MTYSLIYYTSHLDSVIIELSRKLTKKKSIFKSFSSFARFFVFIFSKLKEYLIMITDATKHSYFHITMKTKEKIELRVLLFSFEQKVDIINVCCAFIIFLVICSLCNLPISVGTLILYDNSWKKNKFFNYLFSS